MRLMIDIKVSTMVMAFLIGLSRACAQINEPAENTRIWLASFLNGSPGSTEKSGAVFRESLGLGIGKPLSRSWLFSPSLWWVARETSRATRSDIEGHVT